MSANGRSFVDEPVSVPKKTTRVAQLGAKIKSVATVGSYNKADSTQKRPAPTLPPEARRGAERPQELNRYAASKAKGEPTNFLDLVRSLGELRTVGEKGHRQLLSSVLPRLAQHELPPASLVPQLIQLAAASDDKKLVRFVYYLLQLVLGSGSAGTPSPAAGEPTAAIVSLPADISSRAWADVTKPETLPALTDLQLRTLSAAGRALDGPGLEKSVSEAVRAVLDRAEAGTGLGVLKKSKAQQRVHLDAWELHWSALISTRNTLQGKAGTRIALRSSMGIISPEPVGARHALALLSIAMRENAAGVFKEDKDLAGLMAATASVYEISGPVIEADKKAPADSRRTVNFADKWGRVELGRLCAAAVYADWTSTQDFVQGVGAAFWKLLGLLATRDVEDLVALEAMKSMFGTVALSKQPQGPAAAAEEARNVKLRVRAWLLVSSYAGKPVGYEKGVKGTEGEPLAAAICTRLKQALALNASVPRQCTACRAAGAILEAATRASGRAARGSKEPAELQKMLREIIARLTILAEGSGSPAARCAAIEAVLWSQAASKEPVVSPAVLGRHIATNSQWPRDLLQALLERVYQVLRATPSAAPQLLQIASAISASAAASVQPDRLLELWSAALKLPNGRSAALSAALGLLASSSLPAAPPAADTTTPQMRARAAADEAGWLELLRNAAWWLGEHANLACNEFAGSLPPPEQVNENEAPQASTTPLETTALESFRNPPMAAVISHLQHAVLTLPPGPRTAAVQALAKVAVRSEEPYRLQCYSILASLDRSHRSAEPDIHGVACVVQPVLPILDMLYSSRLVLERLARHYGRMPQKWPPVVVAQLRQRHILLEKRIQRVICSLSSASYFVLGPLSRDLLTSGVESLAPQPSIPRPQLPGLRTAVSMSSQDTLQSPIGASGTARHSRNNSTLSEVGANALFSGPDPLAALTDNLNQHLTAEAFKPRAPAPWEIATTSFEPPSTIPEEASFGFADRDAPQTPTSQRASRGNSASITENVQYMRERGVAVHRFNAEMSDELTVQNGEEVDVEAEVDGWLHCVNRYGIKGLVPQSYIRILSADEGGSDVASQLFGGHGAPRHQREPSMDLLNQPDMLSAFLGPSQTEDDWGSSSAPYHTRDASYHDDFDLPPAISDDNVGGSMAIPEPEPYIEPEPDYVEQGTPEEDDIPIAPDNPFTDSVEAQTVDDNPFNGPGLPQPEQAVSFESSLPQPRSPHLPQPMSDPLYEESSPTASMPQPISEVAYEPQSLPPAGSSARPPFAAAAPRAIATAKLDSTYSMEQPLSARVEHEGNLHPVASGARSMDFANLASAPSGMSTSGDRQALPGGGAVQYELPPTSSRSHSRQLSKELAANGPSRQVSFSEALPQARHFRQGSFDSAGTPAAGSRQESMDLSMLALRGTVLYGFEAETDDELTVNPGDAIVVQAEVDGWYQVTRVSDGRRGLIPVSYATTNPS